MPTQQPKVIDPAPDIVFEGNGWVRVNARAMAQLLALEAELKAEMERKD